MSIYGLDVNDNFDDPDIAASAAFAVTRPAQAIGPNGDALDTPTTFVNIPGSVTPDRARTLQRTAAMQKQVQSIRIITTFPLSVGGGIDSDNSIDADIVTWNGATYTVIAVQDWSQWGGGFYEATADMLDYVRAA